MATPRKLAGAVVRRCVRFARSFEPTRTDITILVPAYNAARHIGLFLQFYRDVLQLPVRVFVDSKTTDDTASIARQFTDNVSMIENPATIVEPIIGSMSRACGTTWVLRIDDDELPTLAMLEFVDRAIRENRADVYGFERPQCVIARDGQLLQWDHPEANRPVQWRLYRVNRVAFIGDIHTPGFRMPNRFRQEIAPPDACLLHLDWAVRTLPERRNKHALYDAHMGVVSSEQRHRTVEANSPRWRFAPFAAPEFASFARKVSELYPELCVDFPAPGAAGSSR